MKEGTTLFRDRPEQQMLISRRHLKTSPLNKRDGFTLIEVLVAMFISVIAVSSTYKLLTYSRDILRSSSNRLEALNSTRGAIEYLRTLDFNADELDVGNHSTTLNGQSFQYNIVLYDGDADLKQITVQTAWQSELSDAMRQVELVSMVSLPLHSE